MGLPLALAFTEVGLACRVVDHNESRLASIASGSLPFFEPGAESRLANALERGLIEFSPDISGIDGCESVIVVVGTPVDEFGNSKPRALLGLMNELQSFLGSCRLLVLRSTLSIGASKAIENLLCASQPTLGVAYCPERIAQHQAFDEIRNLPQLIAGNTPEAAARAKALFGQISDETVEMSMEEAELAKLMANAWRYAKFALANDFRRVAEELGIDFENVRTKVSHNYPRAKDIPRSGFAAGPCLLKDTQQLISSSPVDLVTLRAAVSANETMPKFVRRSVESLASPKATIGILGMAFKPRSDDIRDSLAYRLKHELSFRFKEVLACDPYVSKDTDPDLVDLAEVLGRADVLVIGCPHPEFSKISPEVPVVDIWGLRDWVPAEN